MIENEILMVNKLVKTNKINYDNYLLKDGSLEYRVDNIKDPRKLRFSPILLIMLLELQNHLIPKIVGISVVKIILI